MKRVLNKKLILLLSCSFFISSFTLDDVSYFGRYVDLNNNKFHLTIFEVPFYIHQNVIDKYSFAEFQIEEAAKSWNMAASYFRFKIDKSIYPNGSPNPEHEGIVNNVNVISFDMNGVLFESYDSTLKSHDVAYTYNMVSSLDAYSCQNWYDPWLVGADIILNPNLFFVGNTDTITNKSKVKYVDFQSIILHELGHAAGIDHHPNSSTSDVMYYDLTNNTSKRTLTAIDFFSIQRLYGGYDKEQESSIPCSKFVSVVAKKCQTSEYKSGCGECCNKEQRKMSGLSENAMKNMILFRIKNLSYNTYYLEQEIINDHKTLLALLNSKDIKLGRLQRCINNLRSVVAPMADASFRCNCHEGKNLALTQKHIDAIVELLSELLKDEIPISKPLKRECKKLQDALPELRGKTIQEAAVYYDKKGIKL